MNTRWLIAGALAAVAGGVLLARAPTAPPIDPLSTAASTAPHAPVSASTPTPLAGGADVTAPAGRGSRLSFPTPYIPAQCYAATEPLAEATAAAKPARNPCYACHQRSRAPNYISDEDLQLERSFAEVARKNPWRNLFVDRSEAVGAITDEVIERYVATDNYLGPKGVPRLAELAQQVPRDWDVDGDGAWSGYVPDASFAFDEKGFDRGPGGEYSGWRVLAYYPLEGAFVPTNGSFGDVLVRLPQVYREDEQGEFQLDVYVLNLAVVEALLKRENVAIDPVDERRFDVDLNRDGKLAMATQVTYQWEPRKGRKMSYVGAARGLAKDGPLAAGLFPRGTEFLHSVRYLDASGEQVGMAPRMKELRYARKKNYMNYSKLSQQADKEAQEKRLSPDKVRQVRGDAEHGVLNSQGWIYQGFIEDAAGALRPQSFEELAFCVGCHGGVGATSDGIFSMQRKVSSAEPQHGWYHWSQFGLYGRPEPKRADGLGFYSAYLRHSASGDDFQCNDELSQKFAGKDVGQELVADVTAFLLPSAERARTLNKAYLSIVREQSFAFGRDATVKPPPGVVESFQPDQPTGVHAAIAPPWLAPL